MTVLWRSYFAHTLLILCSYNSHARPGLSSARCTPSCYDARAGTGTARPRRAPRRRPGGVPVRAASPPSPQRSLAACVLGRLRAVDMGGAGARGNACGGRRAGQSEVGLTTGAPGRPSYVVDVAAVGVRRSAVVGRRRRPGDGRPSCLAGSVIVMVIMVTTIPSRERWPMSGC